MPAPQTIASGWGGDKAFLKKKKITALRDLSDEGILLLVLVHQC